ncbi:MAG: hypothetical protein ACYTF3_13730 [Planctomycetota bacterium]|jgi:hypothetical protein
MFVSRPALRGLLAALGLLLVLGSCQRSYSAGGPWGVQAFHPGGSNSSGSRGLESSWAQFAERGSQLHQIRRTENGTLARQVVVCYLAPEGDAGRWDDGGSSSQSNGQWVQMTFHMAYAGSRQGMDHEQDLGYRATWPSAAPGAPLDFEEIQLGGRGLPVAADLFVVVRATHPSSLLTCQIDPAWPEVRADAVGFLDAACAAHPDIDAALSFAR